MQNDILAMIKNYRLLVKYTASIADYPCSQHDHYCKPCEALTLLRGIGEARPLPSDESFGGAYTSAQGQELLNEIGEMK